MIVGSAAQLPKAFKTDEMPFTKENTKEIIEKEVAEVKILSE